MVHCLSILLVGSRNGVSKFDLGKNIGPSKCAYGCVRPSSDPSSSLLLLSEVGHNQSVYTNAASCCVKEQSSQRCTR